MSDSPLSPTPRPPHRRYPPASGEISDPHPPPPVPPPHRKPPSNLHYWFTTAIALLAASSAFLHGCGPNLFS